MNLKTKKKRSVSAEMANERENALGERKNPVSCKI